MEFESVQRIGVFKFKHIGDVLLMTPALRELRQRFPQAHITAVVHAFAAPMLANNPDLDEVVSARHLVTKTGLGHRLGIETGLLRAVRRQRFDLAIDFGTNERAIWCSWLGGARLRAGHLYHQWKPGAWQRRLMTHLYPPMAKATRRAHPHQVLKDLWLVRQLGAGTPVGVRGEGEAAEVLGPEDTMERHPLALHPGEDDQTWARTFLQPHAGRRLVVLHPVSRWMSKCWRTDRLAAVIDWLQRERGARVVLTASSDPKEIEYARSIEDQAATRPVLVPGTASLGQFGALIQAADAFVGIDSAPMHMAAALGTPQVALFGVTKPEDWGPWSPRATTLYHPLSPKDPRMRGYDKRHRLHPSMELITEEEVRAALDRVLDA